MTTRPTVYTCLTALLLFCTVLQAAAQPAGPAIDFTSDTQGRLFIEKLIRQHNHNEQATQLIFRDVNARRPAALFILGDVVSLGYLNAKWKPVDANLKLLRANGIPVYGALGNHELILNAAAGQKQFQARFPDHSPTGYTRVIDSVAILLLNSNFSKITPAQIQRQDAWYRQTLAQLNADPAIKLIIVGCHHSPYSNSTVVGSSLPVQQHFVPPFLQTKKCVLFLSGHSHNFEAFTISGKQFLVIGGGGGVHQPLNATPQALPDRAAHYKPQFHYLQVTRLHDTLQLISRRLKPDLSGFEDGWSMMLGKVQ
jgi:hypothetical protein